jgi:hypothetical protein
VVLKTELPALLGEELTRQSCTGKAIKLLAGENNSSVHLAQNGHELPKFQLQPDLWTE